MSHRQFDIIIIGAGIVGCLIARNLARYKLKILLIDKESDIGTGSSSANTAIVHAGYYPLPGTLKATMNTAGNPLWDNLSKELNFAFQRQGGYVVAIGEKELSGLAELAERAITNGVADVEVISGGEMSCREPNINPSVRGALWIPSIGICDPFGAVVAAAENAVMNGVTLMLETKFEEFLKTDSKIIGIKTDKGIFESRWVVNAAGLYSDEVMHKAGIRPEFKINPVSGEYYVIDSTEKVTDNILFPVPTAESKGVLVTTTTHGNTMVGPNAQESHDPNSRPVTKEGLENIWHYGLKLIPGLNRRNIIASFAGLRATGNGKTPGVNYNHDFVIEIPTNIHGLVNIGGIDSPGLTSAPAIADYVIELIRETGEILIERPAWNPLRPARARFRDLNDDERAKLIRKNPSYGRIVCRCETVTEGEILAEIHAPIPARTYDALKRRTWLGTGRCQGAFDIPRVVKILADELGIFPEQVSKKGPHSEFLTGPTKENSQ